MVATTRGWRRFGWAAIGIGAAPSMAQAGPWLPESEVQSIAGATYGRAEDGVRAEGDLFVEGRFGRRWSVVGQARADKEGEGGAQETALALKRAFVTDGGLAIAAQAGIAWRNTDMRDDPCERGGGEARLMLGKSSRSGALFGTVEAAARQSGACGHARAEATAGWRPAERWLTMAQVFHDRDLDYSGVLKAQWSVVRFGRGGNAVQVGLRADMEGGEVRNPALVIALWRDHSGSGKRARRIRTPEEPRLRPIDPAPIE